MARLVRYQGSLRGIKALRSSREVDAELGRRAQNIASAAEATYAALGEHINVEVLQQDSDTSEPRARAAAIARSPKALRVEAEHRVLGGSLDAAR